jgi:hypothetical protein
MDCAREHKRKEQNEERGGSPLAFTPVAPPAVLIIRAVAFPGEITFTCKK